MGVIMNRINKMIIYTVIQTIFMIFLCIFSFIIFNNLDLMKVQEELSYTNREVIQNENAYIAIDEFSNEEQLTINITNESNTYENYNILLTSDINLEKIDEYVYIKIDDISYILEDLLLKDNYYQIISGRLKASNKQIKIFFAVENEFVDIFKDNISFSFINENIVI